MISINQLLTKTIKMIFGTEKRRVVVLCFLMLVGFSGFSQESPFSTSGKTVDDEGGDGRPCIKRPEVWVFFHRLKNDDGGFAKLPCDQTYVGITAENGVTDYILIETEDFTEIKETTKGPEAIPIYRNLFVSNNPDLFDVFDPECKDGKVSATFKVELFCSDYDSNEYIPIQYCGDTPWERFLGGLVGKPTDCADNEDDNRLQYEIAQTMCCIEIGIHREPILQPFVNLGHNIEVSFAGQSTSYRVVDEIETKLRRVVFMDSSGNVVFDRNLNKSTFLLEHDLYPVGLYFITVMTDKERYTQKVFIR